MRILNSESFFSISVPTFNSVNIFLTETLRDAKSQENNNEQTHVQLPPVTGSGPTPTDSFASSSRTGSDIGSTPTSEMVEDVTEKNKPDSPKKAGAQNKSEPVSHSLIKACNFL